MNRLFPIYFLISNDFSGMLIPDKEAEKADTRRTKSHSLELCKETCLKFLL